VDTGFRQKLAREVSRAYRHSRTLGLVMVQVDPGQAEKDTDLAISASRIIEQSLRIEDLVVLETDGTFAVLLPETGEDTREVARRLTSNLGKLRIHPGVEGSPSAPNRVGWAWFPQDAKTAPALMTQARARMGSAPGA